jgi:hypothetical protein
MAELLIQLGIVLIGVSLGLLLALALLKGGNDDDDQFPGGMA